jgi:tetratricopeptide (TPR) repeat protein
MTTITPGYRACLLHPIQSTKSRTRLAVLSIVAYFLWCSCFQVFADNRTFVALSLRNCEREIDAIGGDSTNLKEKRPRIYFLSGITRPAFVVFDEDARDAILVGEQSKDGVVLTMDDWITALRAAIIHPEEDPGVTIDPTVCDECKKKGMFGCPHTSTQNVKFFAGIENTHFGEVCYEADWWMKLLSAGKIRSPVNGVRSFIDLVGEDAQANRMSASLLQTRFWFYPIINRVNLLDNMVLLQDFQMGVFTQVMYAEENGHPVLNLSRQYNAPSDKFATSLTESFGALAESEEVLASLRELTRLSALAKGCARSSNSFDFRQLISIYHDVKITTPTNKEVVIQRDLNRKLEFRGGVELKALAMRLKEGDASVFRQIVFKARPKVEEVSWTFVVTLKNGVPEGVTVTPQTGSDHEAAELLAQGGFLYRNNRFEDAAKCFESILKDFPNCDDAACMKAVSMREDTLIKAGQSPESDFKKVQASTQLLEEVTRRNPECVQAFFELGVTHRAFRLSSEAVDAFDRAIKLSPDFAAAHYMLGLTWKDLKNYTNAEICFRTVLSLESDTETAKDASEQLALVQQSLKGGGRRTLKEYTLKQQGLSLRYPDDWLALTPEEVQKKTRGNNVLTPACVLVVSNPDNWGQNVTIQITPWPGHNYLSPQDLESRVPGLKEHMEKQLEGFKEVSHKIFEVAEVPALEFDCSSIGWGKRQRQRSVVFVKGQRLFTITCTAVQSEFADAEAKSFQFIIDTLTIEAPQP